MNAFELYRSPYSWRYGSQALRTIWSEHNKRQLWRRLWLALAEIQQQFGVVSAEQVQDLRDHVEDIDIPRALEIERDLRHDVMAEVHTYAEQCPVGGGVIHLGMTSMDVVDNADALRNKASLELIIQKLQGLLVVFSRKVIAYADVAIIAYTHLQPAEPTTLGYRLAQYLQDLYSCFEDLQRLLAEYRGKGLKGAVGNRASYRELFGEVDLDTIENLFAEKIDLQFFPVSTQTYPRLQDYRLISSLAGTAAILNKFAFDLRILQMPAVGEWSEPRRKSQIGSSAMPFKQNPIRAENVNSLARLLAQFPRVAWDDTAFNLLERTLDDSANRRTILPESFLILDEMLSTIQIILSDLGHDSQASRRNLETYAVFAAQEPLLMALSKAGADRQVMHERLRQHANQAWQAVKEGRANPLLEGLSKDPEITRYIRPGEVEAIVQSAKQHLGDAERLAKSLAETILSSLEATTDR